MPLYSHKCPKCGNEWDVFKRLADCGSRRKCPECGRMTRQSLFARPNILEWPPAGTPKDQIRDNGSGVHMEHVTAEGKTFHTRKELQRYSRRHGLHTGACDG